MLRGGKGLEDGYGLLARALAIIGGELREHLAEAGAVDLTQASDVGDVSRLGKEGGKLAEVNRVLLLHCGPHLSADQAFGHRWKGRIEARVGLGTV